MVLKNAISFDKNNYKNSGILITEWVEVLNCSYIVFDVF